MSMARQLGALSACFALAVVLVPTVLRAQACQPCSDGVALFQHSNFGGRCTVLAPGVYPEPDDLRFPEDKASSVRVGSGGVIQVCQHRFLEGVCEVFRETDPNFGDNPIRHDRVSSAVVLGPGFSPFDCQLGAATPFFNSTDRILSSSGARGPRCFLSATVVVRLKQDRRFWFDRTLATARGSGTNVDVPVRYDCQFQGSKSVYTETEARGRKVQSPRIGIHFCG